VDERRILEMRKGRRMTLSRKEDVVIVIAACAVIIIIFATSSLPTSPSM
jgi:hypothetical protein